MELVSSYRCPSSFTIVRRGMVFQPQQQWTIMATQSPSPRLLIKTKNKLEVNLRRSANYHPKIIESINTPYTYELYGTKLEELKQETKRVLESTRDHSSLLKLIDTMQRLGVSYHFEEEIEEAICDHVNPIMGPYKAMEELPEYMKICYLAMFNFGNEIAYAVLKNHGLDVLSYIKEQWTNLCRSYLVEARWFYSGYTPTLDEYLDNSWTSVGGPAAITHAYLMLGFPLTLDSLDGLKISSDTIYWASLITRLSDDLGTSRDEIERGDVAKSIHCCMIKEGVSEEEARDCIKDLISFSWKKLNEATAKINHRHHPARSIITMSLNMARTAQSIFQHGDGIGTSIGITKDRLTSLIVKPIPIPIQHVNHQAMLQEPNLLLVAM
ncbi:putative terpene synthase 9 [Camellia lanceoleosa]|uniref:Terpene synthase 9 n=1 Tax=Camellia lanceoleosa TaxID=1840588 RepID=A0ACC0HB78_9ERIC|nr:putative terpene synthase 9 [Camellia lanceoleosa]